MFLFNWLIFGGISLLKDAEIRAKKAGYERASEEYSMVYNDLKREYAEAKQFFESEYADHKKYIDKLNTKLRSLEEEEQRLKLEISRYESEYRSATTGSTMTNSIGSIAGGLVLFEDILKMFDAEQQGYNEAKELYMEKIEKLQANLHRIEIEARRINRELGDMVNKYLLAIQEKQFEIANLNMELQVINEYGK